MQIKHLLTILPLTLLSVQICKGDAFSDLSNSCMQKKLPCIWLYRRANFQPGDQGPKNAGDEVSCQTNKDHDKLCQYNLNSGSLIGCGGSFMGVTFVNGEANVIFEPAEGAGDFRYTWRKGGNLKSNGIDILDVYCTLAKK